MPVSTCGSVLKSSRTSLHKPLIACLSLTRGTAHGRLSSLFWQGAVYKYAIPERGRSKTKIDLRILNFKVEQFVSQYFSVLRPFGKINNQKS